MSTPSQLELDIRLPGCRPLVCVRTVMELLDRDEDAVTSLIEMGTLRWAFNIAADGATRREIRIYRESLMDYIRGAHLQPGYFKAEDTTQWPDILRDILGGREAHLSARRLSNRFTCSPTHIYGLIDSGLLVPLNREWRRGPNGSALITRSSISAFLQPRRLC